MAAMQAGLSKWWRVSESKFNWIPDIWKRHLDQLCIRHTPISAATENENTNDDVDDFAVDASPMIGNPDDDVVLETPKSVVATLDEGMP